MTHSMLRCWPPSRSRCRTCSKPIFAISEMNGGESDSTSRAHSLQIWSYRWAPICPSSLIQNYAAEHALDAWEPLVVVEKSYLSLGLHHIAPSASLC
ncbi:hypothetical protein [Paenibacillus sp. QZ-Y1]|uniref:hypothetical protein n=1 Tax=Paenibacillus sp. QZ-Y1 TaxID=3414511 RepID=UPI003F79EE00